MDKSNEFLLKLELKNSKSSQGDIVAQFRMDGDFDAITGAIGAMFLTHVYVHALFVAGDARAKLMAKAKAKITSQDLNTNKN